MIQITLEGGTVVNLEPDSVELVLEGAAGDCLILIGTGKSTVSLKVMESANSLEARIEAERGYPIEKPDSGDFTAGEPPPPPFQEPDPNSDGFSI